MAQEILVAGEKEALPETACLVETAWASASRSAAGCAAAAYCKFHC
jgi:hypothetical protein